MRSDKEYKELTIKEFCVERDGSKTKSREYFNTHSRSRLAHGGYWRHDYKYALYRIWWRNQKQGIAVAT